MRSSDADRWVRNIRDLVSGPDPGGAPPPGPGGDRFEILGVLGEGGAAIVHRARDRRLGREVALKILREPFGSDAGLRERFRRETAVAAGLSHPNVVAVHDAGESEGRPYLVMELVDGTSLVEMLRRGDRNLEELVRILEKAARGVAAVHQQGIVHRDLKPANILMTRDGEPKVADFGLAHIAGSETALTRSGTLLGTPLYMSPEQVRGAAREVGRRSDVYALGAILYEALTGRPPHLGDSVTELCTRISNDDPASPRRLNPGVPRDLETIVMKALEKDPDRRYATADALADELRRHLDGEPIEARPASAIARLWRRAIRHRRTLLPIAAILLVAGAVSAWAVVDGLRKGDAARVADERARAFRCLQRGQAFLGRSDYAQAIALYDEAIRLDPQNPEGWNFRGVARLFTKDFKGAVADFDEAIRIVPDETRYWSNRGTARHRMLDLEGAEADFTRALESDDANPTAFLNRGLIRKDRGNFKAAAADIEQALRIAPADWTNRETARRQLDELKRHLEH